MKLQDLMQVSLGRRRRKRVGRGVRSGHGKTCCRGHKGHGARSGSGGFVGYEGGQTPWFRRLPKRGFSNEKFRVQYAVVNVGDLNGFAAGSEVTPGLLFNEGLVRKAGLPIKVLGGGGLDVPLKVSAHKFSETAARKIAEAGGEVKKL